MDKKIDEFLSKLISAHNLGVFDIDEKLLNQLIAFYREQDDRKYLALLVEFRGFQAQLRLLLQRRQSD